MDADVRPGRECCLELIPEFRRLVAKVPIAMFVARRKVTLLRSCPFLVGADTQDDSRITFLLEQLFQSIGLERRAASYAAHRMVHAGSQRLLVLSHDQIEMPFAGEAISIFNHGRDLITGIDMEQRE